MATLQPHSFLVAEPVFQRFPAFLRGVVLAFDVTNCPTPPELVAELREAEASVRARLDLATLAEFPQIKSWREAYRAMGVKPSEFRSSIEGMCRRALNGKELPAINALVDIGNVLSLRHLLPVGGHAIDRLRGDMELRLAKGDEEFVAFGSDVLEHPDPGEIIFADGQTVLTRRWTWRQGNHTLTELTTRAIEFNVDGLPPVTPAEVEAVCREMQAMVVKYCGGRTRYEIVSAHNPRIELKEL